MEKITFEFLPVSEAVSIESDTRCLVKLEDDSFQIAVWDGSCFCDEGCWIYSFGEVIYENVVSFCPIKH